MAPYLPDGDVPELRGQREDPEQFNFTQGGLKELVVSLHRLVGDVVVAGNAAQLCHLQQGQASEEAERHPTAHGTNSRY